GSLLDASVIKYVTPPDKVSVTLRSTVTGTSLLFGGHNTAGSATQVTTGAVLSMRTTGDVKVAVLPATSATVTVPVTAAPSLVNTSGLGKDVPATPDTASAVANAIATSALYQPAALAAGDAAAHMSVGGVLSIRTTGDVKVDELPATSVTVTVPVISSPSVVTTKGLAGDVLATPETTSSVAN